MRRQQRKQHIGFLVLAFCLASTSAFGQLEVPQLSVTEMVERSSEQLKEMDSVIQAAFDSLEQARSDEDLQRISCINDALTAMKGLLKLAEENMLSLRENAARSDRESAEFEHMKISIASDKFVELDAQVRSCGGPAMDGSIDGRPVVNKIFNDDLPEADPSDSFKDTEVLLDRPPSASVFQ